jgi:Zn-dependent protease with chaperone function
MRLRFPVVVVALCGLWLGLAGPAGSAGAAPAAPPAAAPAGGTTVGFDPEAATEAYLARRSPAERARSDAYFEGGYWLQLWDFLWGLGVAWLLLASGLSARVRDLVERAMRFQFLRAALYGLFYILAAAFLSFPLTLYEGFFRERRYGLLNQTFGAWLRDSLVGLAIGAAIGALALGVLYAVFRRAPRTWWLWGTGLALALMIVTSLVYPVFIAPLFNTYTEITAPAVRDPILSMARANGVPAEHVYVYDASRQTKRIGANVSGFLGTLRISLTDNLLRRTSPAAVKAVMGHEIGHYVLNHVYEMILSFGLLFLAGFAWLRWSSGWAFRRWGGRFRLRGLADPAGLPLLAALLSVYLFASTPLFNTVVRSNEAEADAFGLNASREPDGMAESALLLGEYRKMRPGPLEEWIFFDHPSGYDRILRAMRWKAEHLGEAR